MVIDPAPFWAILVLYTYENEYMSKLISNYKVKYAIFMQLNVLLMILNKDKNSF